VPDFSEMMKIRKVQQSAGRIKNAINDNIWIGERVFTALVSRLNCLFPHSGIRCLMILRKGRMKLAERIKSDNYHFDEGLQGSKAIL
jgi:hypothetical protein